MRPVKKNRKRQLTLRQAANLLGIDIESAMHSTDASCIREASAEFDRKQFYYIVSKLARQLEDEIGKERLSRSMSAISSGRSDIAKEAGKLGISQGDLLLLIQKNKVLSIRALERKVREILSREKKK